MSTPSKRGLKKQAKKAAAATREKYLSSLRSEYDAIQGKKELSAEDITRAQEIANELGGTKYADDTAAIERAGRANARYSPLVKGALALGGVGASIGQINKANQLRNGLVAPAIPTAPGIDPLLNQQIFNAQRGTMDAGRAAAAANVGINDAYNQAVQEATNTAAGQAGARQAMIDAANLRKMRASVALAPELDAIRAREEGRADNLIAQRSQLAQENYGRQLQAAGMGLDQYNRQAAAVGALGAVGHENLFGQLGDLSENIIPAAEAIRHPYQQRKAKRIKNADDYDAILNANLNGRVAPTYNPGAPVSVEAGITNQGRVTPSF